MKEQTIQRESWHECMRFTFESILREGWLGKSLASFHKQLLKLGAKPRVQKILLAIFGALGGALVGAWYGVLWWAFFEIVARALVWAEGAVLLFLMVALFIGAAIGGADEGTSFAEGVSKHETDVARRVSAKMGTRPFKTGLYERGLAKALAAFHKMLSALGAETGMKKVLLGVFGALVSAPLGALYGVLIWAVAEIAAHILTWAWWLLMFGLPAFLSIEMAIIGVGVGRSVEGGGNMKPILCEPGAL